MSNFDESLVVRDGAGKFADKQHSDAEVTLPGSEAWRSTAYVGIDHIPDAPGEKFDEVQPGGYDEIWLNGDGNLRFFLRGRMHRSDGPALFGPNGEYEHWVGGSRVSPPQPDLLLRSIDEDGTQTWTSASGKREAIRRSGGSEEHYQDGDLHRDGGPAVVYSNGEGDWYRQGTLQESPVPERSIRDGDGGATGSLYVEARPVKTIAKELGKLVQVGHRAGMLHPGTDADITVQAPRGGTPVITLTVTGIKQFRESDGLLNAEGAELLRHANRQLMAFHHGRWEGENLIQNFVPVLELAD